MRFSRQPGINRWNAAAPHGFTLIELLVTISVLAVLLAIAAPSFKNAVLGSTLTSQANSLAASALLARSEAIKRNAATTLCVSTDGSTCGSGGWEQGWIVLAGTTVLQRQQASTSGLKITESGGATSLSFQPAGAGTTAATLTVCRATPTAGNQERVITISATGRPSIAKTTTGTCA